ncbi:Gfo/Idh/MocA family oxidoreductase [Actinoallomurus spadix]|uniref:Gfo/Idh/MocA family oxidoreductase n=1 Tax=Actinoallomurus spadix TaxID=79912 RepID=A0ABN0W1G7_9ACTN|nr:Gfo/Idh/MocA family oxidoreductase [Actinoallomurus spadix]MCO5985365.1 Gfo/Idh/MocA family oxidoreductase [Actinoallomurus spadix]
MIRVGVLGCADIAWRRTLPAMAASPLLTVAAHASRDPAKAGRFAERFGGEPLTCYRALLDRADIDAVYVPLPAALHAEWATRAVEAGKHVLVEKPLTTSHAATVRLLAAGRARGLVVQENLMFLHHPQHTAVQKMVDDGRIGELRAFTASMGIPRRAGEDIRLRSELGGGALLDVGVYPVRAAQLFLGPHLDVRGAALRHDASYGVDVGGAALLARADGVTAELSFGFGMSYRNMYALWGEDGRISLHRAFTPPDTWQPVIEIRHGDRTEQHVLPAAPQFTESLHHFARHVLTGTIPDADPMLRHAALMDAIRERAGTTTHRRSTRGRARP